jgi:hypothetical protein
MAKDLAVSEQPKELAVIEKHEITPSIWNVIKDMAPMMFRSRLFGVSSEDQAAAILLKGYECGFGFANSFDLIQVIQGKPGVSPRGALALIMQSPHIKEVKIERIVDSEGEYMGHSCTMTRDNKMTYTAQFTLEDAKRACLVKDDSGWKKYPENMCLWRAVGFCADVVAPDITSGMTNLMKMPEAYGVALTEGGDIIDVQPKPEQPVNTVFAPSRTELTLNDLVAKYGPEKIMEVNNGMIPASQSEVNAVAQLLESVGA